ncbi:unnamed protein product, partial [Rotaria sp. Silwood2]
MLRAVALELELVLNNAHANTFVLALINKPNALALLASQLMNALVLALI